jgi:tRNA A-37 threonylcarbamoyl transferase component Bud32
MRTCPKCKTKFPMNVTFCLNDGTPLLEPGELTEGMVVSGKYKIIAKTGQADMSTLYKALHLRLDEVRALKVMNAELARDPLFLKRFEQEALLTRKLQHPNVLRVDDIEETEDGRPFMVMEYIEGKTLKEVIKEEGPLAAWRVCAIARQVASALDAAHQLGMIHRDIKPDNIELVQTPTGEQAKVLEFGVAKMKEARREENAGMLTLSGAMAIIGTPQYMSPELCMGKRGDELDGRSDLYTLGIVMYEMLTAALPFKSGTMMNMIMAHVQTPPAPIQSARPEVKVPEPLANLVMKCLEKERDSRPASAKAMVEELDKILEGLSTPPGVKKPAPAAEAPPARAATPPAAVPAPPAFEPPPPAPAAPAAQPRAEVRVEPPVAPKPVAATVETPAPRPAVPAAAPPAKSSGGIIGIAVVAVIVLGLGGWYVLRSRNSSEVTPAPAATQAPAPAPKAQPVSEPKAEPPAAAEPSAPPEETPAPPETKQESTKEKTAATEQARAAEELRVAAARRREQVAAAVRQGDLFYQNGRYDNAIREYEKGLSVDPSSVVLRQKIDRAKKAKATEEALQ